MQLCGDGEGIGTEDSGDEEKAANCEAPTQNE